MLSRFSHIWFFATPWTVARRAPLSMEFSKQVYWSGWPSRRSSRPRDQTPVSGVSCIGRWILYHERPLGNPGKSRMKDVYWGIQVTETKKMQSFCKTLQDGTRECICDLWRWRGTHIWGLFFLDVMAKIRDYRLLSECSLHITAWFPCFRLK